MDEIKKNILYLSYDGMTDPLGQSQVLPYICGLAKNGYQFTLISCEKPDRYEKYKSIIEAICLENNINWQPVFYHKSPPILSTLWDINQIQRLAYKIDKKIEFDLVHCRGYIPALIGLGMKRRFGTKFLFDMRGLWADEKVDAGAWNLSKPIYKAIYQFFKRKEREFFLNVDFAVSLTHAGKKEIQSWDYMQGLEDKIAVIPCCADTDLFSDANINENDKSNWRKNLGIQENQFILSYLGSIGTWYMLDEMLDFFIELKKQKATAKFLFITHDEHEKIKQAASDRNILDDIIIQPAQRNEVAQILNLSDLSIFFIRSTYSKISSSPTKQGEIMAMGIPLICNKGVGDTDSIVEKYHSGKIVEDFSKECYSSTIEKHFSAHYDNQSIRNGAIDYFSLEGGVERYRAIYKKLLD